MKLSEFADVIKNRQVELEKTSAEVSAKAKFFADGFYQGIEKLGSDLSQCSIEREHIEKMAISDDLV